MKTSPKFAATGIATAAFGAALVFGSVVASAVDTNDVLGTEEAAIVAALQQDGYEVLEVEAEDGYLEAEVLRDGKEFEIYVDAETGKVVKIEEED